MDFSLSFKGFKSRKKVTRSFISGQALLTYAQISWNYFFLCQFQLSFFDCKTF